MRARDWTDREKFRFVILQRSDGSIIRNQISVAARTSFGGCARSMCLVLTLREIGNNLRLMQRAHIRTRAIMRSQSFASRRRNPIRRRRLVCARFPVKRSSVNKTISIKIDTPLSRRFRKILFLRTREERKTPFEINNLRGVCVRIRYIRARAILARSVINNQRCCKTVNDILTPRQAVLVAGRGITELINDGDP